MNRTGREDPVLPASTEETLQLMLAVPGMKIFLDLCDILSPLLHCHHGHSTAILEDALFQNSQCLESEVARARKRYTSSPRDTPAVRIFSPALTPISIFLSYGKSFHFKPSLNGKEGYLPEMDEYSRFY